MSSSPRPLPDDPLPPVRKNLRSGVETGLFLVAFYLYVWLVIDPRLIHHSIMSGLPFYYYPFSIHTGWPFFQELLEDRKSVV